VKRTGSRVLVGHSQSIRELAQEIERVGRSDAKVLITGESGVGKEVVAVNLHAKSPRAGRPLIALNCAGIPETLLESELFGHTKGSFTGAYRDEPGKLELADRGTIFLDEVGEMSLRMQGLLLRFLETGEVQKVGSRARSTVDVRVVSATNRDPLEMIEQGRFREDLFYRLNVIRIHVPPLRERRQDIPALIDHFLVKFSGRSDGANGQHANGNGNGNGKSWELSPELSEVLVQYSWPGNVRELENVIERLVVRASGAVLGTADLPPEIRAQRGVALRPKKERRRTVADDLYERLTQKRESFWSAVYPLYMQREITRSNVRDVIRKGLEETNGSYKVLARKFNLEAGDYKRFLGFLRKHDCQLPFKEYR